MAKRRSEIGVGGKGGKGGKGGSLESPRTALDEQFCQVYYNLDDGNCEALRDTVRSEIRGSGTPTLELGDPSRKPVMVFIHGWPDTHALWANQFAAFCGEQGEFACVAPSLMDLNPDVAPADPEKLSWPLQADVIHEVVTDLGLEDITFVLHDFGSVVGSMYVAKFPEDVKRVVAMDVGNNPLPSGPFQASPAQPGAPSAAVLQVLQPFQQQAISAFNGMDDAAMDGIIQFFLSSFGPAFSPPCSLCKVAPDSKVGIGHRTGWLQNQWVNEDPPWTSFFDTPYSDFEFTYSPFWPDDVPQLFLYGSETFFTPELLTFLDGRGDGSGHQHIGIEHWFHSRVTVNETNEAMAAFFEATSDAGKGGKGGKGGS